MKLSTEALDILQFGKVRHERPRSPENICAECAGWGEWRDPKTFNLICCHICGGSGRKVARPEMKNLFVLGSDVVDAAAGMEDLRATIDGLMEMGLFRLPFERDVYIKLTDAKGLGPNLQVIFGPYGEDQAASAVVSDLDGRCTLDPMASENPELADGTRRMCAWLEAVLIVLLATKNTVKVTTHNKLAKLGIGKRNKFATTTTISLPHDLPDDPEHPATGAAKSAHLRRGHIRRQHYGVGNQLEKKIWIAPVFVNADPDFVSARESYKFSGWLK
jgi:hypothetical protein